MYSTITDKFVTAYDVNETRKIIALLKGNIETYKYTSLLYGKITLATNFTENIVEEIMEAIDDNTKQHLTRLPEYQFDYHIIYSGKTAEVLLSYGFKEEIDYRHIPEITRLTKLGAKETMQYNNTRLDHDRTLKDSYIQVYDLFSLSKEFANIVTVQVFGNVGYLYRLKTDYQIKTCWKNKAEVSEEEFIAYATAKLKFSYIPNHTFSMTYGYVRHDGFVIRDDKLNIDDKFITWCERDINEDEFKYTDTQKRDTTTGYPEEITESIYGMWWYSDE